MLTAFTLGEISLPDLSGNLQRTKGIIFDVCPPQGHSAHGRVERKIRTLQDSLVRSGMSGSRVTATGWQTVAKAIEREINEIPIGFLYEEEAGEGNPLLCVLKPSSLMGFNKSDRAPKGLLSIPESANDVMSKIENVFDLWYKCWVISYVPVIMNHPAWGAHRLHSV